MSIDWQRVSEADCLGMIYTAGGLVNDASLADLWPSIRLRVEERNRTTATRLFDGYADDMLEQASSRFFVRLGQPPPLKVQEGVTHPLSSYYHTILVRLRRSTGPSDWRLGNNLVILSPARYGESPDPKSLDPSAEVEKRDNAETIREEIKQLDEKDKDIIMEVFWNGTSREELARRLGCSSKTIHVRIKKAFDLLGRRLRLKGL